MNEFELIKQYLTDARDHATICLGIGDDAAVLQVPAGRQLAISMDTLVAGVHFPHESQARDIATRALCVNLSDLAAMGAQPLWFTLGLTLPEVDESWIKDFSEGLFQVAREHQCILVGGDLTRGPLTITIQVHGAVDPETLLSRGGAAVGDRVFVTGSVGDGAAALALLQEKKSFPDVDEDYLLKRFYCPTPQCEVGQGLLGIASACIDISDGLVADLGHICQASGVGARIDTDALPLSPQALAAGENQARTWALNGGDDYQLCFTVPESRCDALSQWQTPVTEIGVITPAPSDSSGNRVICYHQGEILSLPTQGYQHFV